MASSTDGEEARSILNSASTLLLQLKNMQRLDWQADPSTTQLLLLLREWLLTHGTRPSLQVGADYTKNSGIVSASLSIEMLREMQQNVLSRIKENGFPEEGQQLVVSAEVPLTQNEGTRLSIRLKTEKVLYD